MGKFALVAIGVGIGYMFGFRDARAHEHDVVTRVVEQIRTSIGRPGTDVDSLMNHLEGRK